MLRMLKEIKPFIFTILIIVVLLFVQAMAELALPDYMSNIVNVGIQQKGIENAVPDVIRVDRLEKIKAVLRENEEELVTKSYKLLDRGLLSDREYEYYLKKYPSLEKESLYVFDTLDKKEIARLNTILGKAILIVWGMELDISNVQGVAALFEDLPQGVDPLKP